MSSFRGQVGRGEPAGDWEVAVGAVGDSGEGQVLEVKCKRHVRRRE